MIHGNTFRDHLKRNPALLILGSVFLFFGLWIDFHWIPDHPSIFLYIVNLFPGTAMLVVWYYASRATKRKCVIINAGILLTATIVIMLYYINFLVALFSPSVNIQDYAAVRKNLSDTPLVDHFPTVIPQNATNVSFEYSPGMMQAGNSFRLKLSLPKDEINDLLKYYRANAKYIYRGGDINDFSNLSVERPTSFYFTSDNESISLDTFEIFILDAELWEPDYYLDHLYSYGAAIDSENLVIIYWAEDF